MKVSELGEFGLIDLLAEMVSVSAGEQAAPGLILGIGDDAAAWHGDTSVQLATVDSVIENIHFSLSTTTWNELGWKALAVNLSDIAAMGGVPRYALVSLALPADTEVDDVTALYKGMIELARQSGTAIVGGDTCRAAEVSVNVTVVGSAVDGQMMTRSGARPGDQIAVTGYLGAAAAGLRMLSDRQEFSPEDTASLKEAFLRPKPRLAEGWLLVRAGVKAGMDLSDGLVSDLGHVCRASRVGARVRVDRIPVHPAVRANYADRSLEMALSGGEDYELLFTAGAELMESARRKIGCPVTVIGEVTDEEPGRVSLFDMDNKPFSLR
ncbi:MAG: thiamine-phosphate kinase, partial [Chloroflexota bacterium]